MMLRATGVVALGMLVATQARAQDVGERVERIAERLEVSAFVGYSFNGDLDFDANQGLAMSDVNFYNSIGPEDRFSFGASVNYDLTSNLQVGLLWSRYSSPLELRGFDAPAALAAGWPGPANGTGAAGTGGTGATGSGVPFPVLATTNGFSPFEIGDMDVNNYHAIVTWNFLRRDSMLRPFVFGGLGLTRYGDVEYQFVDVNGATTGLLTQRVAGESSFSTTWGLGVKVAATERLGIRLTGRWTPARLSGGDFARSATPTGGTLSGGENQGWWCDAYWGCFANDSETHNQFGLTAGVSYRF